MKNIVAMACLMLAGLHIGAAFADEDKICRSFCDADLKRCQKDARSFSSLTVDRSSEKPFSNTHGLRNVENTTTAPEEAALDSVASSREYQVGAQACRGVHLACRRECTTADPVANAASAP